MRISPTLLLLALLLTIFAPSIQNWANQGGTAWYRPYELWLTMIVFVAWSVRRSQRAQQQKSEQNRQEP